MVDPNRQRLLRRGRWIEIAGGGYNALEVLVSLIAGYASGSSALISWGLDSVVETISSGTMVWRLHGEERGIGARDVKWREKVALYVLAVAFFSVSAMILYEAIGTLVRQERAAWSTPGMVILGVALVANPLLAWGKYRTGKRLSNRSLIYDAIDTMVCQYQTVVVIVGLILTATLDWWWADPVAALLIVPYVVWEGFEAAREARRVDSDAAADGEKEQNS